MKVKLTAGAAIAAALAIAQTTAVVVSPVPQLQFFDNNGKPLSLGQVCTYAAGTTTPLTTYTSSTGTTANPNPVILDASGRANIWIAAPAIKYVLRAKGSPQNCSNGTTLYTVDGVQDQALKLRTDITGPGGLAMLTYTPPPTPPVPNPGGGPIPMNQRAAQTINVQDFDTPPFQTCGVSTHDDTPAANAAVNYAKLNGGGRVTWPRGGNCWFNSDTFGGTAVQYSMSHLTFDGNGSTMNTTFTKDLGAIFGPAAGIQSWNAPSRVKYAFAVGTSILPGSYQIPVCTGCGSNFHQGDAVYMQSGSVVSGTPMNGEGNVVASIAGDVLTVRYKTEHLFNYQNPPDGITVVTADTFFDITFVNWRTSPQFTKVLFSIPNCIHCQILDVDADVTAFGSLFVNGTSRDLVLDHVTITDTNPDPSISPVLQFSTGMSDTLVRASHIMCSTPTPGTFSSVFYSEGASNSVWDGGSIGGNCQIGAATYQGAALQNADIALNTGANPEFAFSGAGTGSSTGLIIAGNRMTFPYTGNRSNINLAGDKTQFVGNRIISALQSSVGAIIVSNSCVQCMVADNILTTAGYGFVFQALATGHSFSAVNNNVTCTASNYSAFFIADDGQQTVGESVMGNTANGCGVGLTVTNPAHEIGVFTPNSFAGNKAAYAPASLGGALPLVNGTATNLTTIQTCGTPLAAFTPVVPGGLVIGCGNSTGVNLVTGPGGTMYLVFGTTATPNEAYVGVDGGANWNFAYAGSLYMQMAPGAVKVLQPLAISGSTFTLAGKTCAASGTGGAMLCN